MSEKFSGKESYGIDIVHSNIETTDSLKKFFLYLFLRESGWGRCRQRGRQNPKQSPGPELRAVSTEPDPGLEPMNCRDHDLSQSQTLN